MSLLPSITPRGWKCPWSELHSVLMSESPKEWSSLSSLARKRTWVELYLLKCNGRSLVTETGRVVRVGSLKTFKTPFSVLKPGLPVSSLKKYTYWSTPLSTHLLLVYKVCAWPYRYPMGCRLCWENWEWNIEQTLAWGMGHSSGSTLPQLVRGTRVSSIPKYLSLSLLLSMLSYFFSPLPSSNPNIAQLMSGSAGESWTRGQVQQKQGAHKRTCAVYKKFCAAKFSRFHEFLLSREIKFCEIIAMPPFILHTWIICENIFREFLFRENFPVYGTYYIV